MSHSLLIFSIGPVQSFIAAARKLEDLWSGSFILSHLSNKAIQTMEQKGKEAGLSIEMIFPDTPIKNHEDATLSKSATPNRFVCLVGGETDQAAYLANETAEEIRMKLIKDCHQAIDTVFGSNVQKASMKEMATEQVRGVLEIFWATEPLNDRKNYSDVRNKLEKHLSAVKNNRTFPLHLQDGLVCTLCGEREALHEHPYGEMDPVGKMKKTLDTTWKKRKPAYRVPDKERIRDREYLCGICLARRASREIQKHPQFKSTLEMSDDRYYAIIMMDGDDMGKWLDNWKGECSNRTDPMDIQRTISRRLSHFSGYTVPTYVKEKEGYLIYAGGDDVLAFVSVKKALPLAKALRLAFSNSETGLHQQATASMGIVIAHEKSPLQQLLQHARRLEGVAKSYIHPKTNKEKDAFSLAFLARGGEMREITLPWSMDGTPLQEEEFTTATFLNKLTFHMGEDLSSTFVFTFTQTFLPLLGRRLQSKKWIDPALLTVEIKRLLQRSLLPNSSLSLEDVEQLAEELVQIHELLPSSLQFIHLLGIIRRMAVSYYVNDST